VLELWGGRVGSLDADWNSHRYRASSQSNIYIRIMQIFVDKSDVSYSSTSRGTSKTDSLNKNPAELNPQAQFCRKSGVCT